MSQDSKDNRLPPPAFPPGQRRHVARTAHAHPEAPATETSTDPMIGPDDPLPLRRDPIERAFISPDEPIPERRIELLPEFSDYAQPDPQDGDGEVVGMDLDSHADPMDFSVRMDPLVQEISEGLHRLATALELGGANGLQPVPEMSPFYAALRAYCSGYVAGRAQSDVPADEPEGY